MKGGEGRGGCSQVDQGSGLWIHHARVQFPSFAHQSINGPFVTETQDKPRKHFFCKSSRGFQTHPSKQLVSAKANPQWLFFLPQRHSSTWLTFAATYTVDVASHPALDGGLPHNSLATDRVGLGLRPGMRTQHRVFIPHFFHPRL